MRTSNILIRIRQPPKRIIAQRRIPTHVPNGPAIQHQPNVKAKLDPVDIRIIHPERRRAVLDQADIAIVHHHRDDCHMERLTDIIHITFEYDVQIDRSIDQIEIILQK